MNRLLLLFLLSAIFFVAIVLAGEKFNATGPSFPDNMSTGKEEVEFLKSLQDPQKLATETEKRITNILPQIGEGKEGFSPNKAFMLAKEIDYISRGINSLIGFSDQGGIEPTAERLEKIRIWGEKLQSHNLALTRLALRLGKDSRTQILSDSSRELLNYTLPDESLTRFARQTISDENSNLEQRTKAARLLLEHRMLREEDKKLLFKKGESLRGEAEIKWMGSLAKFGIKPDVDKIVSYLDTVEFKDKNKDQYISSLGPVFQAMSQLSKRELELLRQPLARVLTVFKKEAPEYSIRVQQALDWIDNSTSPERKWARNGSGYLDEPIDWKGEKSQGSEYQEKIRRDEPFKSSKKVSDSELSRNKAAAPEKKSNLPWIIAGVLLVGILALLFKIFKSKSTS